MGNRLKFFFLTFAILIFAGCNTKLKTLSSSNGVTAQGFTYTWQAGSWGPCSATVCGTTGSQTRTVQCLRSDNVIVDVSLCPLSEPALSQSCQAAACPQNNCLNSANRLNVDNLLYIQGQQTVSNADVTQFNNVFGVTPQHPAAAKPWPDIVNLLVNFSIPRSNYVALQFTVPTTMADGTWGTVGAVGAQSTLNATVSLSTTCGDFRVKDNCHAIIPAEGAGILWQVAQQPQSNTCVLIKGQTYFLNISFYNLDGTTNSRCMNTACSTTIQNGPSTAQ